MKKLINNYPVIQCAAWCGMRVAAVRTKEKLFWLAACNVLFPSTWQFSLNVRNSKEKSFKIFL